jgi:hypothetical protein
VIELTKTLERDQLVAAASMVLIHKFFKAHSLTSFTSSLLPVSASCVFLAAKVLYVPLTLDKVVLAFFKLEKRLNREGLSNASLTHDRQLYYRAMIEEMELKVLEAIGFELDLELPYASLRGFIHRHACSVS